MRPPSSAGIHHDGSGLYVSDPLPPLSETVQVRLRVPIGLPLKAAFLRTAPDGEHHLQRMHEVRRDRASVWLEAPLLVHMPHNRYRFKLLLPGGALFLTAAGVSCCEGPDAADFHLLGGAAAGWPAWTAGAVFYQIFVDRFCAGAPPAPGSRPWGAPPLPFAAGGNRDFYGGDLLGIAQRLDYLANLGVTALYLTPIFTAPSNHRYDVSDFEHVDPRVGGDRALAALRLALDARGMRLVLDVTANHVGADHPWFTAAQADAGAASAGFFTFHRHPGDYACWLGHRHLPKLSYRSEALRERMFRGEDAVLRRWLRPPYAIDGWRLDVANMQGRQGAVQLGHKLGRQLRRAVKAERPGALLLGEHFYDGTPHLQGDELDAGMNYQGFTVPLWRWLAGKDLGGEAADPRLLPAEAMAEQWGRYRAAVPWVVARQQYNLLSSHDAARILTTVGGDRRLALLAAVLLFTYPGAPGIYYGDEVGMEGGADPDNRRCMDWDEARWDPELRARYRRLAALRRSEPALREGGFQLLLAEGGLVCFQREAPGQRLVVVAYRGPAPLAEVEVPVWPGGLADGEVLVDLLGQGELPVRGGALQLTGLVAGAAWIFAGPGPL